MKSPADQRRPRSLVLPGRPRRCSSCSSVSGLDAVCPLGVNREAARARVRSILMFLIDRTRAAFPAPAYGTCCCTPRRAQPALAASDALSSLCHGSSGALRGEARFRCSALASRQEASAEAGRSLLLRPFAPALTSALRPTPGYEGSDCCR